MKKIGRRTVDRMEVIASEDEKKPVLVVGSSVLFVGLELKPHPPDRNVRPILHVFTQAKEGTRTVDSLYYDRSRQMRRFWWTSDGGQYGKTRNEAKARLAQMGFDPKLVDRACPPSTDAKKMGEEW